MKLLSTLKRNIKTSLLNNKQITHQQHGKRVENKPKKNTHSSNNKNHPSKTIQNNNKSKNKSTT